MARSDFIVVLYQAFGPIDRREIFQHFNIIKFCLYSAYYDIVVKEKLLPVTCRVFILCNISICKLYSLLFALKIPCYLVGKHPLVSIYSNEIC